MTHNQHEKYLLKKIFWRS